jgi:two-component system sensor kinase FixL
VESLLQDVASLLRSDAIARHVVVEYACDAGTPPIRGDKVHLSQVLINLVMNAMDAVASLPASSRRVRLHARATGNGFVELVVTDSGIGIPREVIARIFDPFFTTKVSGMGVGLSVSRTIVEAHGGQLDARNAEDGGAIFTVRLPASA